MSEWLDKAKNAALTAAENAKKAAQNVNINEVLDKTKSLATTVAEEAKKAAGTVMQKNEETEITAGVEVTSDLEAKGLTGETINKCVEKINKIESMLQEIKDLLR